MIACSACVDGRQQMKGEFRDVFANCDSSSRTDSPNPLAQQPCTGVCVKYSSHEAQGTKHEKRKMWMMRLDR
jgi:hypothetical protein